jgi:hypothetical protein
MAIWQVTGWVEMPAVDRNRLIVVTPRAVVCRFGR